ncbi:MAG: ribose-5-phosphate isomerase RpiA [Chloroflexota bacterium]
MVEAPINGDQAAKQAAALYAACMVEDGMIVGLGTGSTAAPFVRELGARVRAGLRVTGVATSDATARLARGEGIALTTLEDRPRLDMDIDGADAVDPALNLVKGLGGALLREKIVAFAAKRFVVVVHRAKMVSSLAEVPLIPVEIVQFGWSRTRDELEELGATATRRVAHEGSERPFITDGGNFILDCTFTQMLDPGETAARVKGLIGVVEHGLFVGMATDVVIGDSAGQVEVLRR